MNNNPQVTLKSLANQLKLSLSTVSEALNDDSKTNSSTRERVIKLATKMKYRPNLSARNLQMGETKILAVVVDNILACNSRSFITGFEAIASLLGYSTIVTCSEIRNKDSQVYPWLPSVSGIDGIIIFNESNLINPHMPSPIPSNLPVLSIGNCSASHKGINILLDYEQIVYQATLHLIQKGCEQIAFINGPECTSHFGAYSSGYRKAMQEWSIPVNEAVVFSSDLSESAGRDMADRLASQGLPDGVVIADNLCAASFIKHLADRDYIIPKDLLVVSLGDELLAELVSPSITTLNFDYEFIGEKAAEMFISSLDNCSKKSFGVFPACDIILHQRESSDII